MCHEVGRLARFSEHVEVPIAARARRAQDTHKKQGVAVKILPGISVAGIDLVCLCSVKWLARLSTRIT